MKRFDPWDILEIPRNSDTATIKAAFRKLSRMYHPDLSKDDPEATAKFIMVGKAFECLNDESKRKICEKYGNPDGPGKMSRALALPTELLKKENKVLVLTLFVLFFIIIIPITVYVYLNKDSELSSKAYITNFDIYKILLNENFIKTKCIDLIAVVKEYDRM